MDSSKLIREKREELRALRDPKGIDHVLRHLDIAERHFERGRRNGETDAFTDVVYRTNQVFEGILKEAYDAMVEDESPQKPKRLFDLEEYFTKNQVFTARVTDAFKKYRQDWRNPSTHDHRIDLGAAPPPRADSSFSLIT